MLWDCLTSQGRLEESDAQIAKCLQLDPFNAFFRCFHGWHLLYGGRFKEAVEELERTLQIDPHLEAARLGLWGALYRAGDHERALLAAKQFLESRGNDDVADRLVPDHRRHGYTGAMHRAGESLEALAREHYVGALRIARLYAHGTDRVKALQWLEKAFTQREPGVVHIAASWAWIELRPEQKFQDLLSRLATASATGR